LSAEKRVINMCNREKKVRLMLAKESEESLKSSGVRIGVDAGYLSRITGIHRTDISRILNVLNKSGDAIKITGKPVRYLCRKTLETKFGLPCKENRLTKDELLKMLFSSSRKNADYSILDRTFGKDPSSLKIVHEAKSAINYPPNGLHTLLTGPTGSGKTFLAETMYQYGLEIGRFTKQTPFIRFNCSDYANNPQLLLSQLFGHSAGAFTDAKSEKKGLVELANGGILFLDEVHSLPPMGQEMLFTIIDKGVYRRLGETQVERSVNILMIMATSYNPKEVLIPTLLRRIPVIIDIPPLSKRSPEERLNLIRKSFERESRNIKKPIIVTKEVLEMLMSYDCPGNIGQLVSDIKNICSKAYENENQTLLKIYASQLPEHIPMGTVYHAVPSININRLITEDMYIYPNSFEKNKDSEARSIGFLQMLKTEIKDADTVKTIRIENLAFIYLQQFHYFYNDSDIENDELYCLIKSITGNVSVNNELLQCLNLGIYFLCQDLLVSGQFPQHLYKLIKQMKPSAHIYDDLKVSIGILVKKLKLNNAASSLLYYCMLLFIDIIIQKSTINNKIYLLSDKVDDNRRIAETTNKLLGINHVEVLDYSLILEGINTEIEAVSQNTGSVLILDLETSRKVLRNYFRHKLKKDVQIIFNDITTTNVVVSSNKIIQNHWDYEKIKESIELMQPGISAKKALKPITLAILVCDENEGCGHKIKCILENIFKLSGITNFSIHILGINQTKSPDRIKEILDDMTKNKHLEYVIDMVNLENICNGLKVLPFESFLKHENIIRFINEIKEHKHWSKERNEEMTGLLAVHYDELKTSMSKYTSFIDLDRVSELAKQCLHTLEKNLNRKLTHDESARFYIYLTLMLERVISGKSLAVEAFFSSDNKSAELMNLVCFIVEKYYNIHIPKCEKILLGQMTFCRVI